MLSVDENARMTAVGPGTEMGELLRRYWHPVAAVGELEEDPVKPLRVLGEDLVLYRDRSGAYGLLERHCPHRRADLSYGFVEDAGLRCSYHGWLFDGAGRCLEQPFEDVTGTSRFKQRIKVRAYPVQEKAGLLFAYLGPAPAPENPNWELFSYENGFRQIVLAEVACNWLQCAENDIDPVHFEWLHNNWTLEQSGEVGARSPRHVRIAVDEWEFGFGYRRILENTDESSTLWTWPRLHLMPNIFMPGGTHFEYRVPIDDRATLSVVWSYDPVPLEQRPYRQDSIPFWRAQVSDPVTGRLLTSHVINQDTVAWVGQGVVADREHEHLARSDLGVTMLRRQLAADLEAVRRGEDPKGLIRDPERNRLVRWPDERRAVLTAGVPKAQWLAEARAAGNGLRATDDYFKFYAGQPDHIRRAYEAAMGI